MCVKCYRLYHNIVWRAIDDAYEHYPYCGLAVKVKGRLCPSCSFVNSFLQYNILYYTTIYYNIIECNVILYIL